MHNDLTAFFQPANSSVPVISRAVSLCPFPCPSAASFVVSSAATGSYQLFVMCVRLCRCFCLTPSRSIVSAQNVFSPPFSIQVINPILLVSIIRQPGGSINVAEVLPTQPILSIQSRDDSPSIIGQLVKAEVDPSCTPDATAVSAVCTILGDRTCVFQALSVTGVKTEVLPCFSAIVCDSLL